MAEFFITLLILTAEPPAQTDPAASEADPVFVCDFESDSDQNHDRWPDDWTRRRGKGYPVYLPVEIVPDEKPSVPGSHCLRIGLDGGAAQIFSRPFPVAPQFSYQLTAQVRALGLKNDVVSVLVSFYDQDDKLLETFESATMQEANDWTPLMIGPVSPSGDQVRSGIVSIHVRPVGRADLTGEVRVDDLWMGRLPKLWLELNEETGLFSSADAIQATCRISGFKNERPEIKFELLDVYGRILQVSEQVLEAKLEEPKFRSARDRLLDKQRPGYAGSCDWKPTIPSAGFYTVRVSTPSHSGMVMTEGVQLAVMPPLSRGKSGEFGWSLPQADRPLSIQKLPAVLAETGVHWVKFPVWFSAKEMDRANDIAWFAERLSSHNISLVGVLDQPPPEVMAVYGATGRMPIAAALADRGVWHPALNPVITRLSLKVRWWQLGGDDDTSFSSFPNLAAKLGEMEEELARFGQRVNVGTAWQALEERPASTPMPWAFFSYRDLLPFTNEEVKSYLQDGATDGAKRWITLQPLRRSHYDLETRCSDLVQRMLAAKMAGADAVFIPSPFDSEIGVMRENGSPGELLLPWRTTATLIGGTTYSGSLSLPGGSQNHIFSQGPDSVMVLWNRRPTTEVIHLSGESRQFDLWGRESPLDNKALRGVEGATAAVEVPVGTLPSFVTGLNTAIARWQMGFRFDNPRLASVFGRDQAVKFQFTNTFNQGVGGRFKFYLPDEWRSSNLERSFRLSPGETLHDVVRIQLGTDAVAGPQPVRIEFELTADRNYSFSLYDQVEVGMGDIAVQVETRLDEEGNLVVDQHLTNNTDEFVSFRCFLTAPQRRRERQQVFNLGRGRTTVTYVLPNGNQLLGQQIWFRAEEIDGDRILNDFTIATE